jgi:pimeloyl-ACP methyl ester carboxylesterase
VKLAASIVLAVFFAMGGAGAAVAQDFKPCSDADAFAELRGSLCGALRVPLAPSTDNPARIDLFVRKFPAPAPAKGTLWLVSGGPGESGATFYPFLDRLRKSFPGFDLMVPDHRGTGFSTRVCPREEAASSPGGFALVGAEWGTCFQSLNATPDYARAFSITNAAHDLASLIAAFRGPTPTYVYGVSYGTQLVLRMMTIADLDVDGVILDSLVPPQTSPQWDLSHRSAVANKVGRELLRRCDADRKCRAKLGGSAEAALTALLKSVEADQKLRVQFPARI